MRNKGNGVYANPTACIGLEGQVLALTAIGLEAITEIEVFFAREQMSISMKDLLWG